MVSCRVTYPGRSWLAVTAACVLLYGVTASAAQQTRAGEHESRQEEKARQVRPPEPNATERVVRLLDRLGLLGTPVGFYPWFGSVLAGGSFAGGPGVRLPYSDTGVLDAHVGWSVRNYKRARGRVALPETAGGRLRVEMTGEWLHAPDVAFFGVGPDSSPGDPAHFGYEPISAGLTATTDLTPWLGLGGGIELLGIRIAEGSLPGAGIDAVADELPESKAEPHYVVGHLFAAIDSREAPGYTTRGGLYRVHWRHYAQRDGDAFTFRRLDAEVTHAVPLMRANWVIALRALASLTGTGPRRRVPFYLLPTLGGGDELRGFPEFRFRGRHRVLLTGEYRWRPSRFLDMALFYEAGKVASRRADLTLAGLQGSYGIGARFHSPGATAVRLELARSAEGLRVIFGYGPVF